LNIQETVQGGFSAGAITSKTSVTTQTLTIPNDARTVGGVAIKDVKVVKVALGVLDTAGGVLAWANPESATILIQRVFINITTKSSAASTVDIGVAANGTTLNDTMFDGIDAGTGIGIYDNLNATDIAGANAVPKVNIMTSGQYLTASKASGACAGLVGFAYIEYIRL
jgi:hypothetical protein